MGKATIKNDVIELDAEEIPLDEQINQELIKHNVTDAVISNLKEKYGSLQLKDVNDKEGFLEIKDARREVRQWGIICEKLTKKGRENAIAIQKKWLAKEREILEKIAEVQDPLDAEIKKYEDELERKETEAANRREEAYMKRQQLLLKYGATYENGSFVLNHISYEATLVKESDEDIWNETILPKYQREYEKNESERVAIEKKREEDAAAFKAQQEEMERQRKEFENQQAEFRKQQQQLNEQIEAANREKRLVEQKADDERREQTRQKLQARGNQLAALVMTFNFQYDAYVFKDVNVDNKTEICLFDDNEWDELIKKITPVIEQRKQEAEEKRLADIEEQKRIAADEATKKERERIEEEQRQAALKKQQAEEKRLRDMEASDDKTKWNDWLDNFKKTAPVPNMKSPAYRTKAAIAREKIEEIQAL